VNVDTAFGHHEGILAARVLTFSAARSLDGSGDNLSCPRKTLIIIDRRWL
jgi:hypothetical protein